MESLEDGGESQQRNEAEGCLLCIVGNNINKQCGLVMKIMYNIHFGKRLRTRLEGDDSDLFAFYPHISRLFNVNLPGHSNNTHIIHTPKCYGGGARADAINGMGPSNE